MKTRHKRQINTGAAEKKKRRVNGAIGNKIRGNDNTSNKQSSIYIPQQIAVQYFLLFPCVPVAVFLGTAAASRKCRS